MMNRPRRDMSVGVSVDLLLGGWLLGPLPATGWLSEGRTGRQPRLHAAAIRKNTSIVQDRGRLTQASRRAVRRLLRDNAGQPLRQLWELIMK